MLTDEQLELRQTGIGASEIAAACGLSPWQQTAELYLRKIGQADPQEETRDILFGRFMEAGGIAYWSALRGIDVRYPLPTVRHKEYPFLLATGDAQIGEKHGLEFKTMDWFRWKRVEEDGIADAAPEYVFQSQAQMLVMGWEQVTIACLVGKDLYDVPVERNERLQKLIIERASTFWSHVERREPPPIDFSREDALRCVQCMYRDVTDDRAVRLSAEACTAWSQYEALGRAAREAESERKKLKARVLAEIGEHHAGLLEDGLRMVRRRRVEGYSYTAERKPYMDVRAVRYHGEAVVDGDAVSRSADAGARTVPQAE